MRRSAIAHRKATFMVLLGARTVCCSSWRIPKSLFLSMSRFSPEGCVWSYPRVDSRIVQKKGFGDTPAAPGDRWTGSLAPAHLTTETSLTSQFVPWQAPSGFTATLASDMVLVSLLTRMRLTAMGQPAASVPFKTNAGQMELLVGKEACVARRHVAAHTLPATLNKLRAKVPAPQSCTRRRLRGTGALHIARRGCPCGTRGTSSCARRAARPTRPSRPCERRGDTPSLCDASCPPAARGSWGSRRPD